MKNYTRSMLGGLVTAVPPVQVPREASPDLDNVLVRNGAISKRGGFVPMFRDRMLGNAIRNSGYATTSRVTNTVGAADGAFRIVPGHLVAGHRHVYESLTAISFDLFFEVGDLTSQHGGNGINGGGIAYDGAPYTVQVRPILSKGPVHRTADTASTLFGNAQIAWNTTANTVWGNHSNAGMPFCLYLFNSGSGTAPSWTFRLAAHVLVAGTWTLQVVTSGVIPQAGGLYHIVGACSGSRVALRVARIYGNETPTYTANATAFTGTLAWNKCPIQVFDCPQQFIEATTVGSGTQRPGLGISSTASGAYWFATMRAEGRIEDIAIWSGDKFSSTATALDRVLKLDQKRATNLINYWSMTERGTDFVQEMVGRTNHLFMVPRGPVFDANNGGKDGSSWFFNGTTSYALLDVNDASYRYEGTTVSCMTYAVRNNLAHGLHVEFWVDSIEPQFEQVIAEIHGCMRLVITTSGNLRAYVRSGGGAVGSAQSTGENYQTGVDGTIALVPGQRYSVAVLRPAGGLSVSIYVNGALDVTSGALNASTADSRSPVGITLGMGGYEAMIRQAVVDDTTGVGVNDINTDVRSGFVGRIESFKLLAGPSQALSPTYKPEEPTDWRYPEALSWENPIRSIPAQREFVISADADDTIRNVGAGSLFLMEGHTNGGKVVAYVISDSTTSAIVYTIGRQSMDTSSIASGRFGHFLTEGIGARIYHVFGYWRLNRDDRDNLYSGNYVRGIEYRYNGGTPTVFTNARNESKHVHIQFSDVVDDIGLHNAPQRRCVESDLLSETDTALFTQRANWHRRQRPYTFRSPRELGPKWAQGIAIPLPGTVPVTLLTDWEVQTEGRRFAITAAGRQIYWARSPWEEDSPFREVSRAALSCPGQDGSHVFVTAAAAGFNFSGTGTKTTVVFECWVKPDRLDGRRMLAAKMTPATSQAQASWFVSTQDGSIEVQGTLGSGARTWGFTEGGGGGTSVLRRSQSLRVGAWNHLHVTMSTAGVVVRVNGNLVSMLDMSTLTGGTDRRDAHTAAAGDTPTGQLYLCGLPAGRQTLSLAVTASASTVTLATKAWAGLISDVRIRTAEDTTLWPTGADGFPPAQRLTSDGSTVLMLACSEGSGWALTNAASATDRAEVRFVEFVPIAEGLEESRGGRYESVPFRDALILTNGEDHPKRITYAGRYAPTPFKVRNLGVLAPAVVATRVVAQLGGAGATIAAATYQVWMSYLTEDGLESEPVLLTTYVLGAGQLYLILDFEWLPRSDDPQVVGRRFYASPPGGGEAVFNRDIGNDGFMHDVRIYASGGEGVVTGERLEAPRARMVATAGSSLVLADLADEPAGQNAFAFSQPAEPSYFTLGSTVLIDGRDGRPIVGIQTNLSQLFLSKRDSIHQLAIGALVTATEVEASLLPVNGSDGIGGGSVQAMNLLWGAGDRGAFAFDNVTVKAITEPIDPTWRDEIDRSDAGIVAMQGAYYRQQAEYWLAVKRTAAAEPDTVLVFRVGAPGVCRLTVPELRTMAALEEPVRRRPLVALGTTSGSILRLSESDYLDGVDAGVLATGTPTLTGSAGLSGSSTSLTMSGANFLVGGGGLRGAQVSITHDGITEVRAIARNTADTLTWTEPLTGWTSHTSFVIGGYTGRWSTGWIADTLPNREQALQAVGIEVIPNTGDLTVRVASARQGDVLATAFPTTAAAYEQFTRPMGQGWIQDMPVPRTHRQGHYHRLEFRTEGINTPFAVVGYGLEIEAYVARSHSGRTA